MKNIPHKIYLQTGLENNAEMCDDFNELDGISWCADKIYKDDLQYISVDFIFSRIKELETEYYSENSISIRMNIASKIEELKTLIK